MRRGRGAGVDHAANHAAVAFLGRKINRGRRALFAAADVAQVDRLAEPAMGLADQKDRLAFALKASVADLVKSSSRPTPPIEGVGRMPRPLVSL